MLNRIIVQGRLVRDPELKKTTADIPVTTFTLAVERDFRDKETGQKATDFIEVVAWRGAAEFVCQHMAKGRMAVVEGRLQIREWTDKEGNKRRAPEIQATSVYFGDSKRDEEAAQEQKEKPEDFRDIVGDDGDLPF